MKRNGKLVEVNDQLQLSNEYKEIFTQVNQVYQHPNAVKLLELIAGKLQLGITTKELSELSKIGSQEISRSAKILIENDLVIQLNNVTKMLFWKKAVKHSPLQLELYSQYLFKSKQQVTHENFEIFINTLQEYYDTVIKLLKANNNLKEQQIAHGLITNGMINVHTFLQVLVLINILGYGKGHYYLPKPQPELSDLIKQHRIETPPVLLLQSEFYTQDYRLLPFEQQLLKVLQSKTLFTNQYFYKLFYDKKAHTAYLTMITSKYSSILSLEKEKTQATVMMCIKSKYDDLDSQLKKYKLPFIKQYINIKAQNMLEQNQPEAIKEENYTKLEQKDQSNYHKIQEMLLQIKEEKTRLRLKLIGSLLLQQQILTLHQISDYLNLYLFRLGQLSQFTLEKTMLLVDYFINANIATKTKVDLGEGHVFYIHQIIRLADVSEDSKQYKDLIESLQQQQIIQEDNNDDDDAQSDLYTENSHDMDDIDADNDNQITTQYFQRNRIQRICYMYGRILEILYANNNVISSDLKPLYLTTDILIGQLTVMDLLKNFKFFTVVFQNDLQKMISQDKLLIPLVQLEYELILKIFSNKRVFAQIKQYLSYILKILASYGLLSKKSVEQALAKQEDAVTLSAVERQKASYEIKTTNIQIICKGVQCGNAYEITQFIYTQLNEPNNLALQNHIGPLIMFILQILSISSNVGGQNIQKEVRMFRNLSIIKSFIYYMVYAYVMGQNPEMQFTSEEIAAFKYALQSLGDDNLKRFELFKQQMDQIKECGVLKREVKNVLQRGLLLQDIDDISCLELENLHLEIGKDVRSMEVAVVILQAAMIANTMTYIPIQGVQGPILWKIYPNVGYNIETMCNMISKNAVSSQAEQEVLRKPQINSKLHEKQAIVVDENQKAIIQNYLGIPDQMTIQHYETIIGLIQSNQNSIEDQEIIYSNLNLEAEQNYCIKKLALNYFLSFIQGIKYNRSHYCLAVQHLKLYNIQVKQVESLLADQCYYNFCLVSQIMQHIYTKYLKYYLQGKQNANILTELLQKSYLNSENQEPEAQEEIDKFFVIQHQHLIQNKHFTSSIFYNNISSSKIIYRSPKFLKLAELNRLYKLLNYDIQTMDQSDINLFQHHLLFKKCSKEHVIRKIKKSFESKTTQSKKNQQAFIQQLIQRINYNNADNYADMFGSIHGQNIIQSQHTHSESTAISYDAYQTDPNAPYIDQLFQQSYEDTDVQLEVINEQIQLLEESAFSNATQTAELSIGTSVARLSQTFPNSKKTNNRNNQSQMSDVMSNTDQMHNVLTMNMFSPADKKYQQQLQAQQQNIDVSGSLNQEDKFLSIIKQNHQDDFQFLKYLQNKITLSQQKQLLDLEDLIVPNATNVDQRELNQLILQCGYFVQIFVDGKIKYITANSNIKDKYSGSFQIEQLKNISYEGIKQILQECHIIQIMDFIIKYQKIITKIGIDQVLRIFNVLALDQLIVFIDTNRIQQTQLKEDYLGWTIKYNSLV